MLSEHIYRATQCKKIEDWFYSKSGLPRINATYHAGTDPENIIIGSFVIATKSIEMWTSEDRVSAKSVFLGILEELFHYWQFETYGATLLQNIYASHKKKALEEFIEDLTSFRQPKSLRAVIYQTSPLEIEAKSFAKSAYEQFLNKKRTGLFSWMIHRLKRND